MGSYRIKGCRKNDNPYAFTMPTAINTRGRPKNELVVDLGNAVDTNIKVRSGTVCALVKEGHAVLGSDNVGLGLYMTKCLCQYDDLSVLFLKLTETCKFGY